MNEPAIYNLKATHNQRYRQVHLEIISRNNGEQFLRATEVSDTQTLRVTEIPIEQILSAEVKIRKIYR